MSTPEAVAEKETGNRGGYTKHELTCLAEYDFKGSNCPCHDLEPVHEDDRIGLHMQILAMRELGE